MSSTYREAMQRIEMQLADLEGRDPQSRASARALLGSALELHAAGLAKILAIVERASADRAPAVLAALASDDEVASMLVLHDLHPQPLEQRAPRAVENLNSMWRGRGVTIELVAVEGRAIRLRMSGQIGTGCGGGSVESLAESLRQDVLAAVPDVSDVLVERPAEQDQGWIPVARLTGTR